MYENGVGTAKKPTEAVAWYRSAAEKGFAFAQNNLGVAYFKGLGVKQDYVEAYRWYALSAAQGNNGAWENLEKMNEVLSIENIQDIRRHVALTQAETVPLPGKDYATKFLIVRTEMLKGWPRNSEINTIRYCEEFGIPYDPVVSLGKQSLLVHGTIENIGNQNVTILDLAFAFYLSNGTLAHKSDYLNLEEYKALSDKEHVARAKTLLKSPLKPGDRIEFESVLLLTPEEYVQRIFGDLGYRFVTEFKKVETKPAK